MGLEDDLTRAAQFVARRLLASDTEQISRPVLGLVLGSGLGNFAEQLEQAASVAYREIPAMPVASVSGHAGQLWVGKLAGQNVVCLQGRVHSYEGHSPERVTFGVRLLAQLGVETVLLTNAAGGFGQGLAPGDLMLITDHLNLTGQNPLVGALRSGPRFCDMTRTYDPLLGKLAEQAAAELELPLKRGIYAGVLGPSYETPAEVRMLERLGAHAVGMSTVLEAIALRQRGVRLAAISLISNLAAGLSERELSHDEVKATAAQAEADFGALMARWCQLILATPVAGP